MTIRPATPADLERIAFVRNAVWPEYPVTAVDLERADASFSGRRRFALEVNGEVMGHALIDPSYSDDTARFELDVLPSHQARGIGTAFWAWLEAKLASQPRVVVFVPENHEAGFEFARARGFAEQRRTWHQILEPHAVTEDGQLEVTGYEIVAYPEIADPQKLYALYSLTSRDVPGATKNPSFEEYRERILEHPLCKLEAYFVALEGDEWVAYTGTRQQATDRPLEWHTGMTGVLRAHRGRGLAVALKRRVIALARAQGIRELHTNNDSLNAPMLEVNRTLGYRRTSGVIQLERDG